MAAKGQLANTYQVSFARPSARALTKAPAGRQAFIKATDRRRRRIHRWARRYGIANKFRMLAQPSIFGSITVICAPEIAARLATCPYISEITLSGTWQSQVEYATVPNF